MRFILQGPFKENVHILMRKAGYHFLGQDKGELNFTRPARGYPRFHVYLKIEDDNLIFNLHLDQKKPIYKGAPAHAGEYETDTVSKEAERIKQIIYGSLDKF
jgi:hypothetical protein